MVIAGAIGLGVIVGIVIAMLFVMWLGSLCDERNSWGSSADHFSPDRPTRGVFPRLYSPETE